MAPPTKRNVRDRGDDDGMGDLLTVISRSSGPEGAVLPANTVVAVAASVRRADADQWAIRRQHAASIVRPGPAR
jgi:hypothetical protein